jgi:hypothetical protein
MKKYFFISLIAVLFLLGWVTLSVADTGSPRGKSVAASLLPDELKSIKVDDYFVESKRSPAGSIQNATGNVVVLHKDTNRAYFAATGDAVYEQDVFYTLHDSRCRIKFSTEDIITMGENSKVVADEIIDDQVSKKKSSVISMLKGKAMFYVVRLFKYKTVSASVKTPTAVMGVRGTKFGVEVRKAGEKVAGLSDDGFIYLAQNEPGNFETVVYGFDGEVEVNSPADGSKNTVGAGETLVVDNHGAGDVEPTDPNAANRFIKETEGGGGTGGTGGAGEGAGEGGGSTGDTGDNTSESLAQTLTGTANDQTTNITETATGGPTNRMGYFTAMLTNYNGDIYTNNGVFVSGTLQDLNLTGQTANDIVYDYTMVVNGLTGNAGELDSVDYGYGGGIFTGPYPIYREELGHNDYMEWGFWTQNDLMLDNGGESGYDNWVNNRGYYIAGDNTSDISALNQIWTYSGGAEGTYWTHNNGLPDGGINMTGSFNATVDFGTRQITDFDLAVTGGVYNVTIQNETGSFGEGSDFTLDGGTGSWTMTNSVGSAAAELKNGYGSVYGPNAEAIGGVWGVKAYISPDYQYATGIFHGTR